MYSDAHRFVAILHYYILYDIRKNGSNYSFDYIRRYLRNNCFFISEFSIEKKNFQNETALPKRERDLFILRNRL